MDLKDKAATLTEFVKVRIDKYKQTRDLEFKINIALWTLIVLVGHHCQEVLSLSYWVDYIFFGVMALVIVLGHYFLWLVPVSESLARDNAKSLELQKQVENIINDRSDKPERDEAQIRNSYRIWNLFLAGITLLLLLLLGIFLSL